MAGTTGAVFAVEVLRLSIASQGLCVSASGDVCYAVSQPPVDPQLAARRSQHNGSCRNYSSPVAGDYLAGMLKEKAQCFGRHCWGFRRDGDGRLKYLEFVEAVMPSSCPASPHTTDPIPLVCRMPNEALFVSLPVLRLCDCCIVVAAAWRCSPLPALCCSCRCCSCCCGCSGCCFRSPCVVVPAATTVNFLAARAVYRASCCLSFCVYSRVLRVARAAYTHQTVSVHLIR